MALRAITLDRKEETEPSFDIAAERATTKLN